MKKVFQGKRYDTDTAEFLTDLPSTADRGDFAWHDTSVYRTKNAGYFLAGRGHASSMWATCDGNTRGSGEGIKPIAEGEARKHLEQCDTDEATQALEKYFRLEDA